MRKLLQISLIQNGGLIYKRLFTCEVAQSCQKLFTFAS